MTASAANGFAQVLFEPASATLPPGAVHVPPDVRDLERAHARAVGGPQLQRRASDEIGHFEYCSAVSAEGGDCLANNEGELDADDTGCFSAAFSLFVPIGGCIATDNDFDGVSYQPVWPGTDPNRGQDTKYHPSADHVHEPGLQRDRELRPGRLRGRPAPDRGGRLRRQLQPVHRRELREPAAGVELLPDLHDRNLERRPRAGIASGSSAGPTSRAPRTRSAGTRRRSSGRCSSASTRTRTRPSGSGRTTSATS